MASTQVSRNKEILRMPQGRLLQDGDIAGILPYLPDLDTYTFVERYDKTLQIRMGRYKGKHGYVSAEGKSIGSGILDVRVRIQQHGSWDDFSMTPGVFGWTGLMLKGIREPLHPLPLAMVQYLCLQEIVEKKMDVQAIAPNYEDLVKCILHLHKHSAFRSSRDNTERDFDTASISEDYDFSEEDFARVSEDEGSAHSRLSSAFRPAAADVVSDRSITALVGPDTQGSSAGRSPRTFTRRPSSARSTSVDSMESMYSDNILVSIRAYTTNAPTLRSGMKPAKDPALLVAGFKRDVYALDSSDEETVSKKRTPDVTPAGPGVLSVIKQKIAPNLLSRLPVSDSLTFEEHPKPIKYARVRLLVGIYGDKEPGKWGQEVWAYAIPNKRAELSPIIHIEVSETVLNGRQELRRVNWEDDIAKNRVNLEEFARKATSKEELDVMIKVCFLVATKEKKCGFDEDFIPIYPTFIKQLKKICMEWKERMIDAELSDVEYSDEDKSPESYPVRHAHRQKRHKSTHKGVARVLQQPDFEDDTPVINEYEDIETKETNEKVSKAKRKTRSNTIHGLPRVRFDSPHDGLEASRALARPTSKPFLQTSTPAHGAPTSSSRKSSDGQSPTSKYFQQTGKQRHDRHKLNSTATSPNPMFDRRPSAKVNNKMVKKTAAGTNPHLH